MFIKKLIIGLLSFYTFEIKRANYRELPGVDSGIEREVENRKKKEKKKEKTYDNRKWKKKRHYIDRNLKLKGSNPKDLRYSNQQKLRRMFRNS